MPPPNFDKVKFKDGILNNTSNSIILKIPKTLCANYTVSTLLYEFRVAQRRCLQDFLPAPDLLKSQGKLGGLNLKSSLASRFQLPPAV